MTILPTHMIRSMPPQSHTGLCCVRMLCFTECRKAITSYTHFCRTPFCTHGSCGVCPLFTDDAKDDEKVRT